MYRTPIIGSELHKTGWVHGRVSLRRRRCLLLILILVAIQPKAPGFFPEPSYEGRTSGRDLGFSLGDRFHDSPAELPASCHRTGQR